MEPKFRVSFDMESEYEYDGKVYRIRLGAHRINSSEDYFQTQVACIGTVMHRDVDHFHTLPSQEVVELFSRLFECRLVGAKWSEDFSPVYDGKRGPLCQDDRSVYLAEYMNRFSGFDRFRCKAA